MRTPMQKAREQSPHQAKPSSTRPRKSASGQPSGENGIVVQPKGRISQPSSQDEQEAEQVSRQIMARLDHGTSATPSSSPTVTPTGPSEPAETVQRQAEVDTHAAPIGTPVSPKVTSGIRQAQGGGEALARPIRRKMEQAFGADFGSVRVHTDDHAHKLNRSMQARAFTSGQDIFFNRGEYQPESRKGQELLAHELTHVRQQRPKSAGKASSPSSATIHEVVQRMDDESYKAALARFTENIEEELTADYRRRLALMVTDIKDPKAIQKWLGRQTEPDFFDKYEELVAEIIWLIDWRSPKAAKKAVHFDETASTKSSPPSEKKLVSKPSSQSQKSVGGRKKITVSAPTGSAKFVLPSKPSSKSYRSITSQKSEKSQKGEILAPLPVSDQDLSVAQGFFIARSVTEMQEALVTGLQTDGLGPCSGIGLSDDDRTVFALAHLDAEADIAVAIDTMLKAIDKKRLKEKETQPKSYHAWLAAADGSVSSTMPKVKKEIESRKNINLQFQETIGRMQYRLDPFEKEVTKMLKMTEDKPAPSTAYRKGLDFASPLPFKSDKIDGLLSRAVEYYGSFLSRLMKKVCPVGSRSEQLDYLYKKVDASGVVKGLCLKILAGLYSTISPQGLEAIVSATIQAVGKEKPLFKEYDKMIGYLQIAAKDLADYRLVAKLPAYIQGAELSLNHVISCVSE